MTEMGLVPRHGQPPGPAGPAAEPPLTLADEHISLLWQVTARAEELLTAITRGRQPGAELAALAGYAQAEVLRQASYEETLLFPAAPAQDVTGLVFHESQPPCPRTDRSPVERAASGGSIKLTGTRHNPGALRQGRGGSALRGDSSLRTFPARPAGPVDPP